jgi:hypothetical protein
MPRERRRRWIYTTQNTEYHTLDGVCIAVRDRKTNTWLARHAAMRARLEGGVQVDRYGAMLPAPNGPEVGHRIFFEDYEEDQQILTSRLQAIRRPLPEELDHYKVA